MPPTGMHTEAFAPQLHAIVHLYMHAYTHIHIYTNIHTHTTTHTGMRGLSCLRTYTQSGTHNHTHSLTRTTGANMQARTHAWAGIQRFTTHDSSQAADHTDVHHTYPYSHTRLQAGQAYTYIHTRYRSHIHTGAHIQ